MSHKRKPLLCTYWFRTVLLFFMFLIYMRVIGKVENLYWDAAYYWTIANGVINRKTVINLLGFPETFRGCMFPLFLSVIKCFGSVFLGNEILAFHIAQSFFLAAVFGIVLPYLLDIRINDLGSLLRLLLCAGLFLYFWGPLCKVPLSDMPAVAFFCCGLALLKYVCAKEEKTHKSRIQTAAGAFAAGVFLYLSYNARAAYLYGIGVCFIGLVVIMLKDRKRRYVGILFSLMLGALAAALPQMIINQHYTGQFSPKVFTEQLLNYSEPLQRRQVWDGLQYDRYETYVGPASLYPSPGVYYLDPVGTELIAREGLTPESFTYLNLLKLFVKYPLDVCGIYARHLVSLLTLVYSEAYIQDIYQNNTFRIAFNIVLWILGGIGACTVSRKKPDKSLVTKAIAIFGIIVPSLLQFFGACEVRFFLAVHLLFYWWLCFGVEWKKTMALCKKNLLPVLLSGVVIFFAWTTIIGNILISADGDHCFLIAENPGTHTTVAEISEEP